MIELLLRFQVHALWYLTHLDNVQSIFEHGILSHQAVSTRGIHHKRIDWQTVQAMRSKSVKVGGNIVQIHGMVPLFFATHQPMLYVQPNKHYVVHLEVTPDVLLLPDAIFSDGNAAVGATKFYDDPRALEQLDWGVIRNPHCWSKEWKRKKAAEVLVPNRVAPDAVQRVHVMDTSVQWAVSVVAPVEVLRSPDLYSFN